MGDLISIVIPNHNGARFLESCLRSLRAQTYRNMEIILVDNASSDRSIEVLKAEAPEAILVQEKSNLGFAGAVNAGIQHARSEWVVVLNNDTEMPPDWLAECLKGIHEHPDAAFFACKILSFSNRGILYSAGDCFLRAGIGYRRGQELRDREAFQRECPIFAASGCAAIYRRRPLEESGGFDERFFAYLEDVDLGLRLQAANCIGYYLPKAVVYHHGGATSGGEFSRMAVRLRTRNSLLLLTKSIPGIILLKCLPMILIAQLFWVARVLAHGRLLSYVQGCIGALLLAPAMLRERSGMRARWAASDMRLWPKILESEDQARDDFVPAPAGPCSVFLKFYFRFF